MNDEWPASLLASGFAPIGEVVPFEGQAGFRFRPAVQGRSVAADCRAKSRTQHRVNLDIWRYMVTGDSTGERVLMPSAPAASSVTTRRSSSGVGEESQRRFL